MSLPESVRSFLDAGRVAHLATASAAGEPHVVPLCYARLGDRIYFVADAKPKRGAPRALRRLRNLRENPRAALVVDRYSEDWTRLEYVLLHLTAAEVTAEEERMAAISALRARYPQYREMPLEAPAHPVVRLDPLRWHWWSAAGGSRSGRL